MGQSKYSSCSNSERRHLWTGSGTFMRRKPCQFHLLSRVAPALGVALSLALVAVLVACNRGAAQGPQGPPVMPVKVQKIDSQQLGQASEYTATIKSRNSATIMSDVEGWIVAIYVKSGEVVKKGQSLMEIDPRRQAATVSNWESQRAAKQANLQLAKVQLDRA